MPPKKTGAGKPQYVYVIQSEDYYDPNETECSPMDAKRTDLYQVHADLDTANDMAKAHFGELYREYASVSQESVDADDETISIRWEGEIAYGEVTVFKMDLFGGTVKSSKKATTNKASSKVKSKDTVSVSGESEDELERDNYTMVTPSTIAKSATQATSKRKTLADMDEHEDDDHDLSSETPRQLADVEHHYAPGGFGGCLTGKSFLVTGTLDPWTRDQGDALIKEFGGTISANLKSDLDYVVIGAKPGVKKLEELAGKFRDDPIQQITQAQLYYLIASSPGPGPLLTKEHVTDVCKAAKKPPKKRTKKA